MAINVRTKSGTEEEARGGGEKECAQSGGGSGDSKDWTRMHGEEESEKDAHVESSVVLPAALARKRTPVHDNDDEEVHEAGGADAKVSSSLFSFFLIYSFVCASFVVLTFFHFFFFLFFFFLPLLLQIHTSTSHSHQNEKKEKSGTWQGCQDQDVPTSHAWLFRAAALRSHSYGVAHTRRDSRLRCWFVSERTGPRA